MNELSIDLPIQRLLDYLEKTGLLKELELSDEDIADTLWLASYLNNLEAESSQFKTDESSQLERVDKRDIVDSKQDKKKGAALVPSDSNPLEKKTLLDTRGLPFQVPAAPAIQNKLAICRALRPLMRKVPSLTKYIIDEEATVTRIAESDIWLPVTKPKRERWLDLELIVEENSASFIWQETIDELQQLLETHGAFRNVRVWNLSSKDEKLTRRKKDGKISKREHRYGELIHSDRRGLILFVSDCLSSLWQQGKIYNWLKQLKQWSRFQPTAIIQLFPERLWLNSELALGYKVKFKSLAPVVSNSQLIYESPDEDLAESSTLNIPVVTLEAEYLKHWARVIAGYGKSQTPGIVFDLKFIKEFVKEQANELATAENQRESAEIVVDRFLATASVLARQLAGYMAAAPVFLPVVHLIQESLLPKSTPVNVAEVFLSGMIERVNTAEADSPPKYDFVEGARKLLNLAMRLDETEKVLDAISENIAVKLGLSIKTFDAFLLDFDQFEKEEDRQQLLPFARVAIEVLENLGGEYAKLAAEVKPKIEQLTETEPPETDPGSTSTPSPPDPYSKPLEPGEYTLECQGHLSGPRFLNGRTLEARVDLVSRFEGYSGAIWKIDFDEAERIYWLECQGHLSGPRFLNGIPFEKQVNLFPNAENERGGTKWEVESVSNEPASTFRFKCRSSQEGARYLDGRTLDSTVGLSDVSNTNFSGTRWKVELVPDNPPPVPPTELDYAELEDMLRSNNWEEADQLTGKIIWKQAGTLRERSFRAEVSQKFPCEVLRTIDALWTKYSDGRFGFSVQSSIWQSSEVNRDINKFMSHVGWTGWWRENGKDVFGFVLVNDFSDDALKKGQLPWLVTWEGSDGTRDRKAYLSKIVRCGI